MASFIYIIKKILTELFYIYILIWYFFVCVQNIRNKINDYEMITVLQELTVSCRKIHGKKIPKKK